MELSLIEITFVVKNCGSSLYLLKMASPMVDTIPELTTVNCSIRSSNISVSVKLVVSEISFVTSSILCDIDSFACFLTIFKRSLIAGPISKSDLAMKETVVPEKAYLFSLFRDKSPSSVVF